jgi:Tfp pilus assembly protein PilX
MLSRARKRLAGESGFSLPAVMLLLLVGSVFAVASWSAANGDIGQTAADRDGKQAMAAAESGIEYYRYHLAQDNSYWTNCDQVPPPATGQQSPVNQPGAANPNWRNVPGSTARYMIELVPQNGFSQCQVGKAVSMIDASSGTLQVKAIGQSGNARRTVVATLRHKGFLDFLWFTDLETEDPFVYKSSDSDKAAQMAIDCSKWRRSGRPAAPTCGDIVFGTDDQLNGPLHTNDDILTCGTPDFGRKPADNGGHKDAIEIGGPDPGYADGGCSSSGTDPQFWGTKQTDYPTIPIPSSNNDLEKVADPLWTFTGITRIDISGQTMSVKDLSGNILRVGWPPNGVVYVKNGSCTRTYALHQTYSTAQPGCGEAYVRGNYSKSFTLGSADDIIVNGSLIHSGVTTVAGLVANGFVRVYHPVDRTSTSCTNDTTRPAGYPGGGDLGAITIDAAILSVQHQFRVDNYDCGALEGTLTINGAIAQKYRGIVGKVSGTGYIKNYWYDDRLKTQTPPYFLDPVVSEWRVIRFNEQVPSG